MVLIFLKRLLYPFLIEKLSYGVLHKIVIRSGRGTIEEPIGNFSKFFAGTVCISGGEKKSYVESYTRFPFTECSK